MKTGAMQNQQQMLGSNDIFIETSAKVQRESLKLLYNILVNLEEPLNVESLNEEISSA